MGRLLLLTVIVVLILIFTSIELSRLFSKDNRSHEEKRKSFDEDIEAVAKKVKMRE